MKNPPLVSVIIPLYNAEKYIYQALQSILEQSYQNLEILIIDDGSTDKSREIVEQFDSKKIIYLQNKVNLGVSATRNRGFELANGEYIALMDADDISMVTRIEKQVRFLEENPHIGLVSSHYESFRKSFFGTKKRIRKLPIDSDEIEASILFSNVICGGATMIRSKILKEHHLQFDTSLQMAEDFDLWRRLSEVTQVTNLDDVLLKYRKHKNNSIKNRMILDRDFTKVILKSFQKFNIDMQDLLNEDYRLKDSESFVRLHQYLEAILEENVETKKHHQHYLEAAVKKLLYWFFKKHIQQFGHPLYKVFKQLPLTKDIAISKKEYNLSLRIYYISKKLLR